MFAIKGADSADLNDFTTKFTSAKTLYVYNIDGHVQPLLDDPGVSLIAITKNPIFYTNSRRKPYEQGGWTFCALDQCMQYCQIASIYSCPI